MAMHPWNFSIVGSVESLDDLQQLVECIYEDEGGRFNELDSPDAILTLFAAAASEGKPIMLRDDSVGESMYGATRSLCKHLKLGFVESWKDNYAERNRDRHSFWAPGMAKEAESSVQGDHEDILKDILAKPLKEAVGRRVKVAADAPETFPGVFYCPPELIDEARVTPLPAY